MNAASTTLDAQTLFPSASPAWWNHNTSNTRADAPEAKKKSYPHGYGNASIALSNDDGATWTTPIHFAKSDRTVHSLVTSTGKDGPLLITLPGRPALLHVDEKRLLHASSATAAPGPR